MKDSRTTTGTFQIPVAFPASSKKYIVGSRPDLRVPYREIALTPTQHSRGTEDNPPLPVYDCSGLFSEPGAEVDLAKGLPKIRSPWIDERGDTECLQDFSSEYGRQRFNDLLTPPPLSFCTASEACHGGQECDADELCA